LSVSPDPGRVLSTDENDAGRKSVQRRCVQRATCAAGTHDVSSADRADDTSEAVERKPRVS